MSGSQGAQRSRATWRILLTVLATGGILWLLAQRVGGGDDLLRAWSRASGGKLFVASGLGVVALLLAAERWRIVLRASDRSVPYRRSLYGILATWPAASVTPSRLADLLRAVVVRDTVPLGEGIGSVLTEKLFDLQSLLILGLLGALEHGNGFLAASVLLVLTLFWGGFVFAPGLARRELRRLGRWPRLERLGQLLRSVEGLRRAPRLLAALVGLSVTGWFLSTLLIILLLQATGAIVAWPVVLLAWPVAVIAGALPVTVSGLGTRDGVFLWMVSSLVPGAVETAPILAATLLYPLVTSWLYAVVGLPFLAHLIRHDPAARRTVRQLDASGEASGVRGVCGSGRTWPTRDNPLIDEAPVEQTEGCDGPIDPP